MKKKIGKTIGLVAIAIVLIAVLNSAFVIRENQYGIVKEFGKIEKVISEPGLYFKIPMIQEVVTVSMVVLLFVICICDVI